MGTERKSPWSRYAENGCHFDELRPNDNGASGTNTFKSKILMYFGEFLPMEVIDELCNLIHENSYGKCRFCSMPTESLVLSVLQILLDASQKVASNKDNSVHSTNSHHTIENKENDIFDRPFGKGNSQVNKSPAYVRISQVCRPLNNTVHDATTGFNLHSGIEPGSSHRKADEFGLQPNSAKYW